MLRVLTSHRHSALGEVRQAHIGLCSTVNWIGGIPAVGELIREKGCSEAGKSAIRSGLLTAVGPSSPASALITSVGAEFVVDCLCAGRPTTTMPPPPPPEPFWKSPWFIGGLAVAGAATAYVISKRRAAQAPLPPA